MIHGTRMSHRCLTAVLLVLSGCTPPQQKTGDTQDKPSVKTEQITIPASYISNFFYNDERKTPKAVAENMKELGDEYYTAARGEENRDVTITVTDRQRRNLIRANQHQIDSYAKTFLKDNPDYHYEVNEKGTTFDIWLDSNVTFMGSDIVTVLPAYSGYNYYLKHNMGEWDMTISVYNCHSNQLVHQYTKPGETWNFTLSELGD